MSYEERERLWTKVTSVRAVVTLLVMLTFCVIAIGGREIPVAFAAVASSVVTFYFTRSDRKSKEEG